METFFFFASFLPWRFFLFLPQVLSELILVNILPLTLFYLLPLSSHLYLPHFNTPQKTTQFPSCLTAVVAILAAAILTGKSPILRDQPPLSCFRLQYGVCIHLFGRVWLLRGCESDLSTLSVQTAPGLRSSTSGHVCRSMPLRTSYHGSVIIC